MKKSLIILKLATVFATLFLIACTNIPNQGRMDGMMGDNRIDNSVSSVGQRSDLINGDVQGLGNAKSMDTIEISQNQVYNIEAKPVAKEINKNKIRMLSYNGYIPGPILKVKQGSSIYINFTNSMDLSTTIHWHGIRLDNKFDGTQGVTQDPVLHGESFLYKLDFPDEGIYWYHPHIREDLQQELGLYGAILVEPSDKDYYNKVDREEILFLDDISLQENGITPFYQDSVTHTLMGRFGNEMLVNGEETYEIEVNKGDTLRFFIINSANSRTFNFMIENHKLKIIGSDSGKYENEFLSDSVILGASERSILEVLFEKEGTFSIIHKTPDKGYVLGTITVLPSSKKIQNDFYNLKASSEISKKINNYRKYSSKAPDYDFELTIDMSMMDMELHKEMMQHGGMMASNSIEWEDDMPEMNILSTNDNIKWVIRDRQTGKQNMDISYQVNQGDIKKIRILNHPRSMHPMNHPIHIHGQRFLVMSIDGKENKNMAWKDTVFIPAGSTVELLVDFSNPGKWMMHCHIAEHLESGMMSMFEVVP